MLKRLARSAVLGMIAAAAGAAAVGVGAFALYATLKDDLGQGGAAAVVALLFLLIAGLAMIIMRSGGKPQPQAQPQPSSPMGLGGASGLRDRALTLAKERPLLAGAAGVVGAMYVLRNPAIVTAVVGALAGRAEGKAEERRNGWF